MFDIEKARAKNFDETTIKIMERINENNRRRDSCAGHDFEMAGFGRYRCKNFGYETGGEYVAGYRDALRHRGGKTDAD